MARQIVRTSLFVGVVALFSMTTLGTQTSFAETSIGAVEPDPTIVGVIDGPGGIGYWVVSADGSVEVVGTNIVPPLGESEPLTDKVRTAHEGCLLYTSDAADE